MGMPTCDINLLIWSGETDVGRMGDEDLAVEVTMGVGELAVEVKSGKTREGDLMTETESDLLVIESASFFGQNDSLIK